MTKVKDDSEDPKVAALRRRHSLNPRPQSVVDASFSEDEFFDPRDLVQVKYEMLRRASQSDQSVTEACASFGFSRPTFYEFRHTFESEGLSGLIPKRPGPRGPHKLTDEVLDFGEELLQEGWIAPQVLAERIAERFAVKVHPRSIERALRWRKKKRN